MIEMDSNYLSLYKKYRNNSIHIINDATKIDYLELFKKYKLKNHLDYLQIDLEVENESTMKVLELFDKNIFDKYKFATITFEHDIYQKIKKKNEIYEYTRQKSREIFKKHGYICIFKDIHKGNNRRVFEDWYIHPDLVDGDYISNILEINKNNYETNYITNKAINAYYIKF